MKKYKTNEEEFDCIFIMPQEKIFAELKNENILRQPNRIMVPDHMKDKTKFCMFHDDYDHTLATCKNLYAQLRAMIRKRNVAEVPEEESSAEIIKQTSRNRKSGDQNSKRRSSKGSAEKWKWLESQDSDFHIERQ